MPDRRWQDLPAPTRAAVESQTGAVRAMYPASAGSVSDLAGTLDTESGRIFCKAIQTANPLVRMHRNEARLNPWLPEIAPRLRWTVEEEAGWLVLGFNHAPGRHPNLSVGSPDLALIADTLTALTQRLTPCPPIPIQLASTRFAGLIDPELVAGNTLAHTDVTPFNIILGDRVHVVDWSMPCRGAPWIDTAFMVIRLVRAGHTPAQAESWADHVPAWKQAPPDALDAFADGIADLSEQRLAESPAPYRKHLAAAARAWSTHRRLTA